MHPIARRLLDWYGAQARDLPWRRAPTPYHTLLSEIMLQQTRVETVIPYYERFLARWPSIQALAAASLEEVLEAWAGLGYYRRARNLHAAAQRVAELGAFPDDLTGLRALPGVGEYTAAAIASMALGHDALAVDGNLRRVAARLALIDRPVQSGPGARRVQGWLEERLPSGRAGDFNQALMDLGATLCLPSSPRCGACPVVQDCGAHAAGRQEELPAPSPRRPPSPVPVVALLVEHDGALLLVQRPAEGLLAGLWGPPELPLEQGRAAEEGVASLLEGLGLRPATSPRRLGALEHVFTHRRWQVAVFGVQLDVEPAMSAARWWRPGQPGPAPLSRLAERILALHQAVGE
jgi:A/G-specific adenine glycosylase